MGKLITAKGKKKKITAKTQKDKTVWVVPKKRPKDWDPMFSRSLDSQHDPRDSGMKAKHGYHWSTDKTVTDKDFYDHYDHPDFDAWKDRMWDTMRQDIIKKKGKDWVRP